MEGIPLPNLGPTSRQPALIPTPAPPDVAVINPDKEIYVHKTLRLNTHRVEKRPHFFKIWINKTLTLRF